jgi:hypothetical protein
MAAARNPRRLMDHFCSQTIRLIHSYLLEKVWLRSAKSDLRYSSKGVVDRFRVPLQVPATPRRSAVSRLLPGQTELRLKILVGTWTRKGSDTSLAVPGL